MVDVRPLGIDVSHYQQNIDWRKVAASGVKFAFVKATEGLHSTDPEFHGTWPKVYKSGILVRGAYHFGHPDSNAREQARHFVDTVIKAGGFHKGDFAVLDIEDQCAASQRVSPTATAAWVMDWLDEVVALTGLPKRRVLVYTYGPWWSARTHLSAMPSDAGHPLWLAAYVPEKELERRGLFRPWRTWRFWQYTSTGHVNGIVDRQGKPASVDLNLYNGTWKGLWWFSGRPVRFFRKAT